MIVLPAIDIIDGRCVRLTQGDYARETDYGLDPVDVAKGFADAGAKWIHIVDLDGARTGAQVNLKALEAIREAVSVNLEVGGGVRSLAAGQTLVDLGIDRFVVGTRIVQDPEASASFFSTFGARAAAGLDLKDGRPATHGWIHTAERTGLEFALDLQAMGCQRFIVTDIATDGALEGPNLELMRSFAESLSSAVIASGGVSSLDDIRTLTSTGVEGVIVGKAIYEGRFSAKEALYAAGRTSHLCQNQS